MTRILLVIAMITGPAQGVRAEEEEDPGPVDRVVSFFKSLGEKQRERERARASGTVRAEPVKEANEKAKSRASNSNETGAQSLDTPPTTTRRKPARSSRSSSDEKSRESEPAVAKNTREPARTESAPHESSPPEASGRDAKNPPNLDLARKELAELKRKVAVIEAQLAEAGGGNEGAVGAPSKESHEAAGTTAALPPPINPPRNVAPEPAYESKKSFANGAEVTLKLPDQGANAPSVNVPNPGGAASHAAAPAADSVPVGTKTDKPGIVKSPHAPFNEIDVNGLQKGVLAKDPTTQKIFRVP